MGTRDERREALRALVAGYVGDVVSGRRAVGALERLAVERHVRDLESGRDDIRFDEESAFDAMEFAEDFVRHTKGRLAGHWFRFDEKPGADGLPMRTTDTAWVAFLFWSLGGWQRLQTNGAWLPRWREFYVSVARGNVKTFFAAIVALLFYVGHGEAAPEVYFGATQREQAARGWKQAAGFVKKCDELAEVLRVHRATYDIARPDDFEATFKALSRNDDEFDGLAPYLCVLDEVHAHRDGGLYDVLRTGLGKRKHGMMLLITTAGANSESFCADHERALIQVLNGVAVDDSAFAFIARPDEGDEPGDPRTWAKANPNLGASVDVDTLRDEWQKAVNNPRDLLEFKRKRLNQWTAGAKAWLSLERWDACSTTFVPPSDVRPLAALACDLSKIDDYTAGAVVFPSKSGTYGVEMGFWIPEDTLAQREKRDRVPVRAWVERGLVVATPGELVDQEVVRDWIVERNHRFDVVQNAFDPAMAPWLISQIEALGFPAMAFPQSWAHMHAAMLATEGLIRERKLEHGGNPPLRWMFSNVAVRENATGLSRPDKAKSTDRIDGVVALIMATHQAMQIEEFSPRIWGLA